MEKYTEGWLGGVTGPNASLTVFIDWHRLKNFSIIKQGSRLIALVPERENPGMAKQIVELLNGSLDHRKNETDRRKVFELRTPHFRRMHDSGRRDSDVVPYTMLPRS